MLNIFKKKVKEVELVAPVNGKAVDLSEVPDKVFASGMMGEGIAFKYTGDTICAPCDGKITTIPNTMHAFGIIAENDAEILVHIGIDTVNLKGEGFKKLVNEGDKVKAGDPIIKLDRSLIESKGYNLITPVLITNSKDYSVEIQNIGDVNAGKSVIASVNK
ncbi:PTS sugar transporter subunit IIA [Companilactobacillus formosensis]|uniref:PTS sugar transporter subunit IIA n=1 Tax=Companilactobacillus formosensis TaxID=1617889 RepID=UPI000E64C15F|nr:PTS glucose transporter subunit IIA [Companilactobacillus formosensis]